MNETNPHQSPTADQSAAIENDPHQSPTADQSAAHEFLAELRTRISTQPLPYQYGVEASALKSLWEIFGQARTIIKKYSGCEKFAAAVTQMLNVHLRPVTAKWHRAHEEGRLNSRDGADEFRGDLEAIQKRLQDFAESMHEMAYGWRVRDELTPPAITKKELDECFHDLAYGIRAGSVPVPPKVIDNINRSEADEVEKRRNQNKITTAIPRMNAVGIGFSGGGIRSATFCLGVSQVLASRGLLKDIDFLSTVSGGGYTGSFITTRLGSGAPQTDIANPCGPDPEPIRYLRQHAKYL